MKSYRIKKEVFLSNEHIRNGFLKPSRGKRDRADVKRILNDLENHIQIVYEMLNQGEFVPSHHEEVILRGSKTKKQRAIHKPDYKYEQVVHHIAVSAMMDAIMSGMYQFVLGSVPRRGAHLGKKYIEKWIRKDPQNTKYVLKMDIHHFFQSVDHDVLKAWLRKKFRDEYLLELLFLIIDACDDGLPLGYYTSQWFANFLLQPLDHYIKEDLHVDKMERYMDDITCFGSNKKRLHEVRRAISKYMEDELHLHMKDNWQVFRFEYEAEEYAITAKSLKELWFVSEDLTAAKIKCKSKMQKGKRKIFVRTSSVRNKMEMMERILKKHGARYVKQTNVYGRPLDFMGFEFHRNKTVMRESIMIATTRKARKISKSEKVCWKTAASFLSSMGWIYHTDTYNMYLNEIKPYVNVRTMKKIVSKHQRRKNNAKNGMETDPGHSGGDAQGSGSGIKPKHSISEKEHCADGKRGQHGNQGEDVGV